MFVCLVFCMFVCLYVCVFVRLYVCMIVCLYVCMFVCLHVFELELVMLVLGLGCVIPWSQFWCWVVRC
jgi:hypothetical protein